MKASIFISRDLQADSPMLKLKDLGYEIHGESLIEITPIAFDTDHGGRWIFFYSQHGVRAYLKHAGKAPVDGLLIAAFGPKTALGLQQQNIPVAFIGNGHAEPTAQAFCRVAEGEKVVFARAQQSMRSVQKALSNQVEAIDLIVYDNVGKTHLNLPASDILVFTSPLNVRTYLSHQFIQDAQQVIAIGPSTEKALRAGGHSNAIVPIRPAEEEIVNLILRRTNEIA